MPGVVVVHSVNHKVTRVLTEKVDDIPDIPDIWDMCDAAEGEVDAANAVPVGCDMCIWSMVKCLFGFDPR